MHAVANGRLAVEKRWENQNNLRFVPDGRSNARDGRFEATAAIRQKESGTKTHLPIIAMTAHAMKGDRERCLEGGMDGYIAKPIQPGRLFEMLQEVVSSSAQLVTAQPADLKPKRQTAGRIIKEDGPLRD